MPDTPADIAPPADIPTTVDTGLGQAVARFQALSDTAGNPGAPTEAHPWVTTVWDALAQDADLGPPTIPELVHRIDDPLCGAHEVHDALWRMVADGTAAHDAAGERWHLLVRPPTRPGPGVAEATELAHAAHAGEPLTHSLNRIGERIDHVASGIANLSIRLRDEHEQVMLLLGRVEGKLDLLAEIRALLAGRTVVHAAPTQAQAQARYDRTLTTMDRVTQYDAQGLIHEHLMAAVRDGQVCDGPTAGRLAHEIAEALYGDATEMAAVPPPDRAHQPGRDGALTWLQKWDAGDDTDVGELVMYVRFLLGVDPSQTRDEGRPDPTRVTR